MQHEFKRSSSEPYFTWVGILQMNHGVYTPIIYLSRRWPSSEKFHLSRRVVPFSRKQLIILSLTVVLVHIISNSGRQPFHLIGLVRKRPPFGDNSSDTRSHQVLIMGFYSMEELLICALDANWWCIDITTFCK